MKKTQQTILVVEDEPGIREMLRLPIQREGFEYQEAQNTMEAINLIEEKTPNLILLDWMLPGQSGLDFARLLRRKKETAKTPIIMLTAKTQEMDKLSGFNAGIDDYLTKPFSIRELVARVHAVLRRTNQDDTENQTLKVNELILEPEFHRVMISDKMIKLGPTEFRLLHYFMKHPERVYSRGQLLNQVWGETVYVEERTVDVHIRRLRKALAEEGYDRYIQTVRSAGYRFSQKGL
jgi:two-component system phosphate regulon response regulator PhoB